MTKSWKHCGKRRNCSFWAISSFVTMFSKSRQNEPFLLFSTIFSTFSHSLSIQLKRFSIFWQNMFKYVCCRIGVWGKGLSSHRGKSPNLAAVHRWLLNTSKLKKKMLRLFFKWLLNTISLLYRWPLTLSLI